jgi:CheY-like chemotaxis protein
MDLHVDMQPTAAVSAAPGTGIVPDVRRVLLAEDDPGLATFVAETLSRSGYDVVVRSHGYAALEALRSESIDVLLTDMMLPGVSGDVLAERARAYRRDLPVVFMTGTYGLPFVLPHDRVLRKPFDEDDLLRAVGEAAGPQR